MNRPLRLFRRIALFALLLSAGALLNGCQTPESSDNEASRPWNAPRQWETGLPGFSGDRR